MASAVPSWFREGIGSSEVEANERIIVTIAERLAAIDRYLDGRTEVTVTPNDKITSSWRHDMPELYDVLPRQHIPMVELPAR